VNRTAAIAACLAGVFFGLLLTVLGVNDASIGGRGGGLVAIVGLALVIAGALVLAWLAGRRNP
jgi:hypothetical protein